MDSFLDGLQREFMRTIMEGEAGQRVDLQVAIQMAMVARFYERIGDHAVNIGERVQYVVTGWLPEHKGAARYKEGIPRPNDDTGAIPIVRDDN
jgi:phosphate transport system protein